MLKAICFCSAVCYIISLFLLCFAILKCLKVMAAELATIFKHHHLHLAPFLFFICVRPTRFFDLLAQRSE
ncbi:hypothetical protein TorRG33x02_107700 [Trema orientale]|uniref:Uncharacterized protein n=1 Tax=Trema orientale TaxID=63057 RepID=A0A2P5F6S1_TREOI|nr:hypothetical protein TorRG33x02_107700 [Trema orientale]